MSSLGIFDKETKTYKKVADLSNIADHDTATSGTSFTDAENGNMLLTDWTKNLLNPTLETVTKNGVTCTNNGDGTYTLNGTASDSVSFSLTSHNDRKGKFKVVGCPKNGSNSTYNILVVISNKSSGTWKSFEEEYGSGIIFENYDDNYVFSVEIQVSKGTTVNNLVFKPIITTDLSATYDDFEPYTGETITVTNDTESPAFGLKSHKGITNIISPGNVEVLYAKSEAGAALLGILNDLSVRLDEYINRLDEATNNRVTITADGLDSLADDVAQHQEAILALQSAQSK